MRRFFRSAWVKVLMGFGIMMAVMLPAASSGQWLDYLPDRAEIRRQINLANEIGTTGRHIEAIDTFLSVMVRHEISDASSIGAELNLLIGIEMMRLKAFPIAKHYLLTAKKYQDMLPIEFHRDLNSVLAGVAVQMHDWKGASGYYHQNLQIQKDSGDSIAIPTDENNLGIFHLEKGDLDSAEWYFQTALADYARYGLEDKYFVGSVQDNLARVYKSRRAYSNALELYQRNVEIYADGEKKHSLMQALNGVAEMENLLGRPQNALPLLTRAANLLHQCNPRFQEALEAEWIRISLLQARAVGNMEAFDRLQARKDAFQDSLLQRLQENLNVLNSGQAALMQRSFMKEKEVQELQLQQERAEIEALQSNVRRIWIIGILLVISAGLLVTLRIRSLRFRQQHLRDQLKLTATQTELMEKKLAEEKLVVENLELKVSLKQQDLVNFALDNQRKRELVQHLGKQLKKLKPGQVTQANINTIINDIMLRTQTETISTHYEANIDVVNAEYKSKLLERFPHLSPSDLELCGMVRLGMQAKEIAAFRNVTENAILTARRRLRKKLKIKTGVDLRAFLSED